MFTPEEIKELNSKRTCIKKHEQSVFIEGFYKGLVIGLLICFVAYLLFSYAPFK